MEGTGIFPELVVRDPETGAVLGTMKELVEKELERNEAVIAGHTFHFGPYQGFTVQSDNDGALSISVTFQAPANVETQSTVSALHNLAIEGKLRALFARRHREACERAGVQSE